MDEAQNLQGQTTTAPDGAGSTEYDAAAAFERLATPAQADEQATDAATDDTADTEAEEADPDAEAEAEETKVIEYEGISLELPAAQAELLEKALLRQADYSRKMNDVTAKEKAYTEKIAQAEQLAEGAEKYAEVKAEIGLIDARIKAFEGLNWQQLRQESPGEYAAYATDLQNLRLARQGAEAKAQSVGSEVERAKFVTLSEQREAMHKALAKDLKGWGDELGTKLTEYATQTGVNRKTLEALTDPAIVIALDKARRFDELQASKATIKAQVKAAPPVLKPGAPRKPNPQTDAMSELRKHRTQDAAEAAFFSRMR